MLSDQAFQIALLISFATHAAILYETPNFNISPAVKGPHKVEVRYLKPSLENKEPLKIIAPKGSPQHKLPSKINAQKPTPPPFVDKNAIAIDKKSPSELIGELNFKKPDFAKPLFNRADIIAVKKKIILPPVDLDRISNPFYISYYQIVREKIRRAAYQHYTRTDVGEVYASFIISSDGSLREVRVVEEKSSANQYLRDIALKSIEDASPFPNFTPALDYPQLSFNVVISFEIE